MYQDINEYMLKSRDTRRKHLRLSLPCIEIGGSGSKEFRGLLAHKLKTTIPKGKFIMLCHACHNWKCSNPNHLYWGSAKDNTIDQMENGTYASISNRSIAKYGEDEYRKRMSQSLQAARAASVIVNTLPPEELERIKLVIESVPEGRGRIVKLSRLLNVSSTHIRRYMKRLNFI